jgi:aspartate-semialdehyde dehydrogenase
LRVLGTFKGDHIDLAEDIKISAQCIRVPILNGHTATVFVKFRKNPTKDELVQALRDYSGEPQALKLPSAPEHFIQYLEDDNRPQVALDVNYERGMGISIGRIREDFIYDWKFVGLSHNTLRGAAGGGVEAAEYLVAKGYITKK